MATAFQQEVMQILGIAETEIPLIPITEQRAFYAVAFAHYEKEDYSSAAHLFKQLVLADPFSAHYWHGLASSEQMAKSYPAAIQAWSMVCLLKEQDPLAHFHAAECMLALDQKEEALKALNAALDRCPNDLLRQKIRSLKKKYYDNSN